MVADRSGNYNLVYTQFWTRDSPGKWLSELFLGGRREIEVIISQCMLEILLIKYWSKCSICIEKV